MTEPTVWPATVRTSINPTTPITVNRAEWLDLSRMGLLVQENPVTPIKKGQ